MEQPAEFNLQPATDRPTVALTGDWTARMLGAAGGELTQALDGLSNFVIDMTGVRRLDTAGAYAVVRAAGKAFDLSKIKARPEAVRLLDVVDNAIQVETPARREPKNFHNLTIRIGRGIVGFLRD